MKSCVAIAMAFALASVLMWVNTPTLAAEKTLEQTAASNMESFINKVGDTCGRIAVKAKRGGHSHSIDDQTGDG